MGREPQALRIVRETLMEHSALAMEEQRYSALVIAQARELRKAVRRMATGNVVISRMDLDAVRLADDLVATAEAALALDVRSHKRHEPPGKAARTRHARA